MMQCRDIDELMVDYLYQELDAARMTELEAHMHGCARCEAEIARLFAYHGAACKPRSEVAGPLSQPYVCASTGADDNSMMKLARSMLAAVAAHDMTVLEPINHATPDRAPVWYHGYTNVTSRGGDKANLTLWLDARAQEGLSMAEAVIHH